MTYNSGSEVFPGVLEENRSCKIPRSVGAQVLARGKELRGKIFPTLQKSPCFECPRRGHLNREGVNTELFCEVSGGYIRPREQCSHDSVEHVTEVVV